MAEQRKSTQWSMDKDGNIQITERFGEEIIGVQIVARYDPVKQIVYFKSQTLLMKYKVGVITHLAADEKLIRSFQREDMKPDAPLTKNIPPRPRKDPMQGDKTPAVVEWYFRHRFNEFCARYGAFLGADKKPLKYSGPVSYMAPVWRDRPGGDGVQEFVGQVRKNEDVTEVIVTQAKTHLTFTPEECVNWDAEAMESEEAPDLGNEKVSVRKQGEDVE